MKKIFVIGSLVILALCLSCSTSKYKNLKASLPELSYKADGIYRGEQNFSGTPIKVILDVDLQNHSIRSIEIIKHSGSSIGRKAESIIDRIIERQSLDIDVVSGSTVSSNAILKAVENALQ